MPLLDTEIIWRPALLQSSSVPAQNGGRMAHSTLVSGVKNNLFPDVSQTERSNGALHWRKAFIHLNSAADTALLNARVFLDALTPAGDFVTFTPGTPTDTEDQISGRDYGIGTLFSPAASEATQIQVACEHPAGYATLVPFRVGDLVRVANRPSTGGAGEEEWVTLTGVTFGAEVASLDFTPALSNAYATADTLVSSVLQVASTLAACSAPAVTSSAGTLNAEQISAHNKGAIEQSWALNFSSTTQFALTGNTLGILAGGGVISADFAPLNPATGTPYFTLKSLAWSGTFQAGDTVTFETHPAAIAVWYRRQIPAGTASLANDFASLGVQGESA